MEADFSGWATRANLKCADGRTIMPDAFKHQDKMTVPLVWQHGHGSPENVLGYAILHNQPEGVRAFGFFNDTRFGQAAKALVKHGDVKALSIFANKLVERAKQVFHGDIKEVSLCLAGANPGAYIDNVTIRHSDGYEEVLDDSILASPWEAPEVMHSDADDADDEDNEEEIDLAHATMQEIYDSLNDDQKKLVNYMVGTALEQGSSAEHSDTDPDGDDEDGDDNPDEDESLGHQEGTPDMTRNVFETHGAGGGQQDTLQHSITREDMRGIVQHAIRHGSLKGAFEDYAISHGIENLDVLFPDAKNLTATPEWNKRRTEWVAGVLNGVSHSPFAKVKSVVADITMDEARALGYIKGNLKKVEWFRLSKRTTGPTTVYKKQQLDRDDIVDITDLNVVTWMKGEMRLMLEEEIARAILIGDGRPDEDPANPGQPNPDKIKDPSAVNDGDGIRSILHEHELYAETIYVPVDPAAPNGYQDAVEGIMLGMEAYKGSGSPTFYTTLGTLNRMLLTKDGMGRRLWRSKQELATEMGVGNIVDVEVMGQEPDVLGIVVNLVDYNVGTDAGGEVTFFDDFDIDYNQYKYLGETRLSGALKRIKSAIIVRKVDSTDTLVVPQAPTFNESTGVVTIPTQTGVVYKNAESGATLTAGPQAALAVGATLNVLATPADGTYYFPNNEDDDWSFTREA